MNKKKTFYQQLSVASFHVSSQIMNEESKFFLNQLSHCCILSQFTVRWEVCHRVWPPGLFLLWPHLNQQVYRSTPAVSSIPTRRYWYWALWPSVSVFRGMLDYHVPRNVSGMFQPKFKPIKCAISGYISSICHFWQRCRILLCEGNTDGANELVGWRVIYFIQCGVTLLVIKEQFQERKAIRRGGHRNTL